MLKTAVFVSGILGFNILESLSDNKNIEIVCIFTDKNSIETINVCKQNKIPYYKGNPRNDSAVNFLKQQKTIDIILSINYLFIINQDLIEIPKLFALNIHGSLLPKYRGRTPHVWAIINGEKKTGITIHKIVKEVDAGDVVIQKKISIGDNDTGSEVLNKFKKLYPIIINEAINLIISNKIQFIPQDEWKATYFGKRTPLDGDIDWDWSKERIKNWVRAQAHPYPGAFTFLNNKKIIINKIKFSSLGFNYKIKNGTVLSVNPVTIKTPNGAIELLDYYFEGNKNSEILKNNILGK